MAMHAKNMICLSYDGGANEAARLYAERQARIWKQNSVFAEELV